MSANDVALLLARLIGRQIAREQALQKERLQPRTHGRDSVR
ncbi:MAG: hypothetical protein ABF917_10275 [Gluconobacter oxydans]